LLRRQAGKRSGVVPALAQDRVRSVLLTRTTDPALPSGQHRTVMPMRKGQMSKIPEGRWVASRRDRPNRARAPLIARLLLRARSWDSLARDTWSDPHA
jgi:hypothetical protein